MGQAESKRRPLLYGREGSHLFAISPGSDTLPSLSIPPQKILFFSFHSFSFISHDVLSTTNIDTTISRDLAQHLRVVAYHQKLATHLAQLLQSTTTLLHPRSPVQAQLSTQHVLTPDSEAGTATDDTDTEATCSSDESNWSDDEDAKSRKVAAEKKARRGRAVWLAFKKLARPVRTFLLAVIFGGIFVTPALIFLFVFPNNPAKPHVVPWSLWIGISWAVACALSLIVDLFPRFLLWIIFVIYGKAPETFKTQLELFMAVSFWLKLALDVSGMWVALSLIRKILHPPGRYWTVINQVMQAIFVAAIILLAEKVFVRIIAIQFHQKALADRLHENRIALKVLDKLSTAIPQFPIATKKKKKNRHSPGNSLDAGMVLGTGFAVPISFGVVKGGANKKEYAVTKEGSAEGTKMEADGTTKVKRTKKSKAVADVLVDQLVDLKDAIGLVALKDSKFNKEGEIASLYSARRLAKQLFSTLSDVYPPRSHLIVEDFYPYFRPDADIQRLLLLNSTKTVHNGEISKKEMREAVQRIYRERKALSASLKDMSSAVSKLDAVMIGVALIIILFVCLLIFNPGDNISSLIPLATIVLGFPTHVYDVGDLVLIDDMVLFVNDFGLFATTFRRVDGQEVVAPNSLLATAKLIHNVRRSGSMWETTNLQIGYETPLDIIEQLKVRLRQYMGMCVAPGVEIWIDSMKYQNCINLVIAIEHRNNWQEWGGRWARRGLFMKHLRTVLEELEIGYQMPLQPVSFHPSSMAR
ncbi:hypothetical protein FRC04_007324 [Tulasnella sp. 424]|nr:hypothetical protein FRC04_007324 [Tulasnella sp. 424]